MIEISMNAKVEAYLRGAKQWREESKKLRDILVGCGLAEEFKWGKPCFTFQDSNVVVIQGFKAYCALLFFKGVLLKDSHRILKKTGENTRVGRQIRFTRGREIDELEPVLKDYIAQAIEVERAGLKVPVDNDPPRELPEELRAKLAESPALKAAFAALTPGRQRAYAFYFAAPKQSKTRQARIEKCAPQILQGRGLNED